MKVNDVLKQKVFHAKAGGAGIKKDFSSTGSTGKEYIRKKAKKKADSAMRKGYRQESSQDAQGESADTAIDNSLQAFDDLNEYGSELKKNTDSVVNGICKRTVKDYSLKKKSIYTMPDKIKGRHANTLKKGGRVLKTKKTEGKAANTVAKPAKKAAQKAAWRSSQVAGKVLKETAKVIKRVVKAVVDILKEAFKSLAELLMVTGAGEVVLIIVIAVILIIFFVVLIIVVAYLLFFASGFGLFSSDNSTELTTVINQLNDEMSVKIEEVKNSSGAYDTYEISNGTSIVSNWRDVLIVFAEKANQTDMDLSSFDAAEEDLLRSVYWEMNSVSSRISITAEEGTRVLYIDIASIDYVSYARATGMSESQINEMMMLETFADETIKKLTGSYVDISLSDEDIEEILEKLNDLPKERQEVVKSAYSLVGKVGYFWGGKSYVSGWDSRWGMPTLVTAGGDETSGTYQPYGLDCSGFVGWVFAQAFDGYRCTQGAANQYNNWCSYAEWHNAIPGDLVFFTDLSHVGIVAAKNDDGTLTVIHCSTNGGVIIGNYSQHSAEFFLIGRPSNFTG